MVLWPSCCGGPSFAMENLRRPPADVANLKDAVIKTMVGGTTTSTTNINSSTTCTIPVKIPLARYLGWPWAPCSARGIGHEPLWRDSMNDQRTIGIKSFQSFCKGFWHCSIDLNCVWWNCLARDYRLFPVVSLTCMENYGECSKSKCHWRWMSGLYLPDCVYFPV